jgi:hypothetical protein
VSFLLGEMHPPLSSRCIQSVASSVPDLRMVAARERVVVMVVAARQPERARRRKMKMQGERTEGTGRHGLRHDFHFKKRV